MIVFEDSFIIMLANKCGMAWPSPCGGRKKTAFEVIAASVDQLTYLSLWWSVTPVKQSSQKWHLGIPNVLAKENTAENAVGNAK